MSVAGEAGLRWPNVADLSDRLGSLPLDASCRILPGIDTSRFGVSFVWPRFVGTKGQSNRKHMLGQAASSGHVETVFQTVLVEAGESSMSDNDQIQQTNEFLEHATGKRTGVLLEFWDYLRDNKKWWLLPILILLLLFGMLVFLSGSAAGPFIYTLF